MGVLEVIILLFLIGCVMCTMYYCYFHKMKRMQQALGLDYRDQTVRRFETGGTRPNETEIYTITAGGFIIREPRANLRECTVVRRDSKIVDLPPSYEEVLRSTNNSGNSQTAQTAQPAQATQAPQTTQTSQTSQTTSASQ